MTTTTTDTPTPETLAGLSQVLAYLEDGHPVLATRAATEKYGIPAIQDVPGAEHLGFGCFAVRKDGKEATFDGGGAMRRDGDLSWTLVGGDRAFLVDLIDYDMESVRARISEVIAAAE